MRIIAGRHRGTKLALPAGTGTRPTADRTRESLFNILAGGRFGAVVDGAVIIDAFAGTGALGLEALSRGCAFASFIERDQQALAALRQNITRLDRADDSRVIAGDALTLARWHGGPATLLLADAPYGSGHGLAATQQLMKIGALSDNALIIIETGNDETMDQNRLLQPGLNCWLHAVTGAPCCIFFAAAVASAARTDVQYQQVTAAPRWAVRDCTVRKAA